MTANSKQVSGSHYQTAIQPWDYIIANQLGYLEGNVVKYVSRYKYKNGVDDLRKAIHYLEKLIEVQINVNCEGQKGCIASGAGHGESHHAGPKGKTVHRKR